MITTSMSATIDADRECVWRAISLPDQVVRWDERTLAFVDDGSSYPVTDERVRWRYRVGRVPSLMSETPLVVKGREALVSKLAAGSLRMRRSYLLFEEDAGDGSRPRTRLAMKLTADNSVPVMGGVIDRFRVREIVIATIDETLRNLRKHCEELSQTE